ncbi:MAG TPA: protein kinase [Blastocatellia bacterium]|nr:protein kinase [Blastocatellia bacterium]
MRANLPDKNYFVGRRVPGRADITVTQWIASGNDGHLFRAHSTELGRDVACKIIPSANLVRDSDGRETWRAEVLKPNALRSPVVVRFDYIGTWHDDSDGVDSVVLISEFVDGPNLSKFIKTCADEITVSFVVDWLATMLNLFNEMKLRGVRHGDLHAGNILVEDRSSYNLLGPRFVFRVTDFGVAEATSEARFKDDYLQLADVLAQLLRVIAAGYPTSPKEKFFCDTLRHHFLERHLIEADLTHDPLARQPAELLRRLQQLDSEFESAATQETPLLTPFDFLSCEQIGEASALLQALYSDRFLGLSEIESRNNVVVTGPRGCGKSTVFRSLGLDHRLRVNEANPDHLRYLGVYYRCDDLYFAFPRYVVPQRSEALDLAIHFVTATLLGKLLDSVESWARRYFEDEFMASEVRSSDALWAALGLLPPHVPGRLTFKALVSQLNKERVRAAEHNRFANDRNRNIARCFGPEVLQNVCEALRTSLSFVRGRPIYFFIDDYSAPKVTKQLQTSLNRVFMQRTSACFFKLSTESPVSFEKSDIDGKIYVENREFVLQNLGLVYLHAGVTQKLSFIEDVFRRRLGNTASGFPARELEELVGSDARQNNNELSRRIREGEKPALWGKEALCGLCSGDIHYVLNLVGDMVRLSGGPDDLALAQGVPKISPPTQNRAIRDAAGNFLKNLRGIPRCGEELVAIVEAFGNVAHSHLKFLDSKNEDGNPPKQATRIEPYEPFTLSVEAQRLYDELLRYAVFIEDFRGKSRRGNVVPRLYLRRFLIPHFNLTFSTRDSIEIEPGDFERFLLKPKRFEQKLRLKSVKAAKKYENSVEASKDQLKLKLDDAG